MSTSPLKISKQHLRINRLIWACFGFWFLTCSKPVYVFSIPRESNHYIFPVIRGQPFVVLTFPCFFFFFFSYLNPVSPRILLALKYTQDLTPFLPTSLLPPPPAAPGPKHWALALGCSSPLIGLPAFPLAFSARHAWHMLHRVDALRKTHRRFLDDSLPEAYQGSLSQNENQNPPSALQGLLQPCLFLSLFQPHFPSDLRHSFSSPGPAVPSGGHLACTPTCFWLLFRYRLTVGLLWTPEKTPAHQPASSSLTPSPALMFFLTAFITVYYIYIICIIFTLYVLYAILCICISV